MSTLIWLAGGAMVIAASGASAQPMPQSHDQHQSAGQHQVDARSEKCCCEEMMRKMMMKMMQQHQGVGTATPKDSPQPDKEHAH